MRKIVRCRNLGLSLSVLRTLRPVPRPSSTRRRSALSSMSSPATSPSRPQRITTQWHKPSAIGRLLRGGPLHRGAGEGRGPPGRPLDRAGRRNRPSWTAGSARGHPDRGQRAPRRARRGSATARRSRPSSPTTRGPPTSPPSSSTWERATGPRTTRAGTSGARSCWPIGPLAAVMDQAVWKRGRCGNPLLGVLAAESAGRLGRPGRLDLRPREGRPERREDDLGVRPLRADGQDAVRPHARRDTTRRSYVGEAKARRTLRCASTS